MGKMFPFITGTWSPVAGECPYDCYRNPITGKPGCWAKKLVDRYHYVKYQGPPRLEEKELRKIPKEGFVFVESMGEISTLNMSDAAKLIGEIEGASTAADFLFLTKNPEWYRRVIEASGDFPFDFYLGATIETNRPITRSKAPPPSERLAAMKWVKENTENETFISVEPIMEFDPEPFLAAILEAKPWAVAVGYDNYHNRLPEPTLEKTLTFIKALHDAGITVYRKTLREAWHITEGIR